MVHTYQLPAKCNSHWCCLFHICDREKGKIELELLHTLPHLYTFRGKGDSDGIYSKSKEIARETSSKQCEDMGRVVGRHGRGVSGQGKAKQEEEQGGP